MEEEKMKRIITGLISAAMVLGGACAMTGCFSLGGVMYPNSKNYSVGDATISDKVEKIEVDWPSGGVKIETHSDNTVLITEEASMSLSDNLRVHWWLDDTTLHVKFCESGEGQKIFSTWRKDLTLTVPETLKLADFSLSVASAEVEADGVQADHIEVSSASGDIDLVCEADRIKLSSASGEIKIEQSGDASAVDCSSASGKIEAVLERADKASFSAASGKISVTAGAADSLSAKTASGDVSYMLDVMPSNCSAKTASGSVTVTLPEDSDFTATVDTTSGDFASDLALKKDGKNYICGDGSGKIMIDTTSGDVSILAK